MALQNKKSRKWLWIGLAAVVVVIGGSVALVAKGSGTKIDPSHLGKATRQDIARSVVATGKVTPITEVELKSKASGIVTELKADANDNVKKGQVLAQLDQAEILAQVAAQTRQPAGCGGFGRDLPGEHRAGPGDGDRARSADVQGHLRPATGNAEGRHRLAAVRG